MRWVRLECSQRGQSSGGVMGPPWQDGEGGGGETSGQSVILEVYMLCCIVIKLILGWLFVADIFGHHSILKHV